MANEGKREYGETSRIFQGGRCVQVSDSLVNMLARCERQAYNVYWLQHKKKPALFFAKGNAIDAMAGKGLTEKQQSRSPDPSDLKDFAVHKFEEEIAQVKASGQELEIEEDEKGRDPILKAQQDIARSAVPFWNQELDSIVPHPEYEVQTSVDLQLASGVKVAMVMDAIGVDEETGEATIHDVKTAKKKWHAGKERQTIQPRLYWWGLKTLTGDDPGHFDFRILAFNERDCTTETRRAEVTRPQLRSLPMLMQSAADRMTRFAQGEKPIPTGWLNGHNMCKARFCAFAEECRAEGYPIPD